MTAYLELVNKSYQKRENLLKSYIVMSTYERIWGNLLNELFESVYFVTFFAKFFNNPIKYPISEDTASLYVRYLMKAHFSSRQSVSRWSIADTNGMHILLLSPYLYSIDDARIGFSKSSTEDLYFWTITDDIIGNASYPYENGTDHGLYNALTEKWYIAAKDQNNTIISSLYIDNILNLSMKKFSAAAPSRNAITNELTFIAAADTLLSSLQHFIKDQKITPNSRLALTTTDGILMAVTGDEEPVDDYNNNLITKSISELQDPIWECVSSNPSFLTNDNYTMQCTINGATYNYQILRSQQAVNTNVNWTLFAAINQDEYSDHFQTEYSKDYIPIFITSSIFIVVLLVVAYIIERFVYNAQHKILFPTNKQISRFQATGFIPATEELQKIILSHNDNVTIVKTVNNIIDDITHSSGERTFQPDYFLSLVENPRVRSKMESIFNFEKYTQKCSHKPLELGEDQMIIDDSAILTHQSIFISSQDTQIQSIISIGCEFNKYFEENTFVEIMTSVVMQIPDDCLMFLADSVSLYHLLMKSHIDKILSNDDTGIMIYFMIITFHLAMRNRYEANSITHRYFLIDDSETHTLLRPILLPLYDNRIDMNQKRWEEMIEMIHYFMEALKFSKQNEIINECYFIINYRDKSKRQKLNKYESIIMGQFLLVISQFSYYFNVSDITYRATESLSRDIQQPDSFLNCFFEESVQTSFDTLFNIFGKKFLLKLWGAI